MVDTSFQMARRVSAIDIFGVRFSSKVEMLNTIIDLVHFASASEHCANPCFSEDYLCGPTAS